MEIKRYNIPKLPRNKYNNTSSNFSYSSGGESLNISSGSIGGDTSNIDLPEWMDKVSESGNTINISESLSVNGDLSVSGTSNLKNVEIEKGKEISFGKYRDINPSNNPDYNAGVRIGSKTSDNSGYIIIRGSSDKGTYIANEKVSTENIEASNNINIGNNNIILDGTNGNITNKGQIDSTGKIITKSDLEVSGDATITGDLDTDDINCNSIDITGNSLIGGNLGVSGDISGKNFTVGGDLKSDNYLSGSLSLRKGWKIDHNGNADFASLVLSEFLEVPELRYNRTYVEIGNTWNAPGGGTIESVEYDRDDDGYVSRTGTITLRLEDCEIGSIREGAFCMGIWYVESSSPTGNDPDNFIFQGFQTIYFQITQIIDRTGHNSRFRYQLRPDYIKHHPHSGMHFVCYGHPTEPSWQKCAYRTKTYTRYLSGVNQWEITKDMIMAQIGDLNGLTIGGKDFSGYSAYLNNIYLSGVVKQVNENTGEVITSLNFCGDYNSNSTYYKGDEVSYNGSLWVCLNDNTSNQVPNTNSSYWTCISSSGIPGASAYEIYKSNGGTLSEKEWLDSLKGGSVSITSITLEWSISNQGTNPPEYGWSSTIPNTTSGDYLWSKNTVNYSDGSRAISYGISYIGGKGNDSVIYELDLDRIILDGKKVANSDNSVIARIKKTIGNNSPTYVDLTGTNDYIEVQITSHLEDLSSTRTYNTKTASWRENNTSMKVYDFMNTTFYYDSVKIIAYVDNKEIDSQEIFILSNGDDALNVICGNQNINIPCDSDGKALDDGEISFELSVYKGTTLMPGFYYVINHEPVGIGFRDGDDEETGFNSYPYIKFAWIKGEKVETGQAEIEISNTEITKTYFVSFNAIIPGSPGEPGGKGTSLVSITQQWYLSSSSSEMKDGSITSTRPTWTNGKYIWSRYIMNFDDDTSNYTNWVCITGEKGSTGATGAIVRVRGIWKQHTAYYNNDQYIDVVFYNGSYYKCKETHTPPQATFNSALWTEFSEFDNLATSCLIANNGYIDVLGSGSLFVGQTDREASGWIMTEGSIKHTESGLELTKEGYLVSPDSLHLKVGESDNLTTNSELLDTGIDIENHKIILTADQFEIYDNSGEVNVWIDDEGNLTTRGIQQSLITNINLNNYNKKLIQYDGENNLRYDIPVSYNYINNSDLDSTDKISSDSTEYLNIQGRSFDVLCCGDIIKIDYVNDVYFWLPHISRTGIVSNSGTISEVGSYFAKTWTRNRGDLHMITLDEMKQLIGRKITIYNNTGTDIILMTGHQISKMPYSVQVKTSENTNTTVSSYYEDRLQRGELYSQIDDTDPSEGLSLMRGCSITLECVLATMPYSYSSGIYSFNQGITWKVVGSKWFEDYLGGTFFGTDLGWGYLESDPV